LGFSFFKWIFVYCITVRCKTQQTINTEMFSFAYGPPIKIGSAKKSEKRLRRLAHRPIFWQSLLLWDYQGRAALDSCLPSLPR
jgi:Uri superfamily endonuclease